MIAVGTRCEEGGEQVEGCPATVSGLSSSTLLVVLPVVCSFQLVIITALALAFYRYYLSILDTGTTKGSRKKCYFYSGFKKGSFFLLPSSLSRVMTSIAELIKTSEYVCTGRDPVQASAVFLNELIISHWSIWIPAVRNRTQFPIFQNCMNM